MSATSDLYFIRAAECARDAEAADLENVRDRFLRAQEAWRKLGDQSLKTEIARDRRDAKPAEALPVNG